MPGWWKASRPRLAVGVTLADPEAPVVGLVVAEVVREAVSVEEAAPAGEAGSAESAAARIGGLQNVAPGRAARSAPHFGWATRFRSSRPPSGCS